MTTVVHIIVDTGDLQKPVQPYVRLLVNSAVLKAKPKPIGGAKGLFVASAHLPTNAEVSIAQLLASEVHAGDGAVGGADDHVEYDPRSYAFSLLFNAVIFIKWNSHFTKYNLAHGYHSFILSSHPVNLGSVRVLGNSPDLGKWSSRRIKAKTLSLRKDLSLTAVMPMGEELEFNLICGMDPETTTENLDQPKSLFSPLRNDIFIYNTWGRGNVSFTFSQQFFLGEEKEEKSHIVFQISDPSKSVHHQRKESQTRSKVVDTLDSGEGMVEKPTEEKEEKESKEEKDKEQAQNLTKAEMVGAEGESQTKEVAHLIQMKKNEEPNLTPKDANERKENTKGECRENSATKQQVLAAIMRAEKGEGVEEKNEHNGLAQLSPITWFENKMDAMKIEERAEKQEAAKTNPATRTKATMVTSDVKNAATITSHHCLGPDTKPKTFLSTLTRGRKKKEKCSENPVAGHEGEIGAEKYEDREFVFCELSPGVKYERSMAAVKAVGDGVKAPEKKISPEDKIEVLDERGRKPSVMKVNECSGDTKKHGPFCAVKRRIKRSLSRRKRDGLK